MREDPAEAVLRAFDGWMDDFRAVTRRARGRFVARAWRQAQADAAARLEAYGTAVDGAVDGLRGAFGEEEAPGVKARFAARVAGRADGELAETFFNSVVRRVLGTVGVRAATEFTADDHRPPDGCPDALWTRHPADGASPDLFRRLFDGCELAGRFAAPAADAEACADALARQLRAAGADPAAVTGAEVLRALFYRNKGAYLVGRLRLAGEAAPRPLLVPLVHPPGGVRPDAVLVDEDEASIVFSFARSYFHVDTPAPGGTVAFLRTLMPRKAPHELYTSIGHNRHGKTELFRELRRHLRTPEARFTRAEGVPGLVMTVFALRGYPVVFKVIRDRFGASKSVSRRGVRQKYRMVFALDRVGRLVDAQEFEGLELPMACFEPEALAELLEAAGESVRLEGDRVVVAHAYTERLLRPLDLYLREAGPAAARAAVDDYGRAIRELAAADIFPGDLLLKNFGVSRHGRVIFYDYDELARVTELRFRAIPKTRHEDDELRASWFAAEENDVFPEEFIPFLVPAGPLRDHFLARHGDLVTVRFWREMQARQQAGEIPDFFPYPASRRLALRPH